MKRSEAVAGNMSRSRRRDEPVITRTMIGLFVVAGADVILLLILLAAVGVTPWDVSLGISGFILAVFGGWALARWWQLRPEPEPADETGATVENPVDRLKTRYADGELTDEEFESKLDRLLESDHRTETAPETRETDRSEASGASQPASDSSELSSGASGPSSERVR